MDRGAWWAMVSGVTKNQTGLSNRHWAFPLLFFLLGFFPLSLDGSLLILQDSVPSFPGGSVVKNLPVSAGDMGSIPDSGRSHMPRGN